MTTGLTDQRLTSFAEKFGQPHLDLACHAAFPMALTPDLLYRLWAHFRCDSQGQPLNIPWVAVADVLLAPFCDEVGFDLYELEADLRTLLLGHLKADPRFGPRRLQELADFLLSYHQVAQLHSDDPDLRDLAQAQRWMAMAQTQSPQLVKDLAHNLVTVPGADGGEWGRMAALLERLSLPDGEGKALQHYAYGMARLAQGDPQTALSYFRQLSGIKRDTVEIAGVPLLVPEELRPRLQLSPQMTRRRWLQWAGWGTAGVIGSVIISRSITSENPDNSREGAGGDQTLDLGTQFSSGEKSLLLGSQSPDQEAGNQAFAKGNYGDAANIFRTVVENFRNEPEPLIYYSNSISLLKGDPFKVAVVVPVDNREISAREMLRGVAQAQHEFNASGGLNGHLLEIVIANDGNEPDNASKVAQEIVKYSSVLGVIGHNSSSATQAGLAIYERAGLPIISPTSTSIQLNSDVFFRTVPSDAAAAEKLAQYARDEMGLSKVVIFYDPVSSYSSSLEAAFKSEFQKLGGSSESKDMTDPQLDAGIEVSSAALINQAEALLLFPNKAYTSVAIELAKANSKLAQNQRMALLSGDSLYSIDTLTAGGDSTEGLILPVAWFAGASQFNDFSQASQSQWGGPVSWRTAMSFDAAQALIKSFSENATRKSTLENLKQINLSPNETSGQGLQFSLEGERKSEPILIQVARSSRNRVPGSDFGFEPLLN